jgi:hypothetical protein
MKTSIIILTIITLFASCGKGPMPLPTEPQLPPITSIGANTFGCKVNGVVFMCEGNPGFLSSEGVEFRYNSINKELNISAETRNPGGNFKIVIKLEDNFMGTFNANKFDSFGLTTSLGLANAIDTLEAKVYISKSTVSLNNASMPGDILSGTFDIKLAYLSKIYHLTEGRFDIKYK